MDLDRRRLIGASAAGMAGALAMPSEPARAAPLTSTLGRDATQYGVRPGSPEDQTRSLQRAIDEAARAPCRWRCRPASIAQARCGYRTARN